MQEYEVEVRNIFEAESPEDAVIQMAEWLAENARITAYRVGVFGSDVTEFIDAEKIY